MQSRCSIIGPVYLLESLFILDVTTVDNQKHQSFLVPRTDKLLIYNAVYDGISYYETLGNYIREYSIHMRWFVI